MKPGIEHWRSEEEKAAQWKEEEKRYMAGWDTDSIKRWMNVKGRDCATVQWVRSSLQRIF